VVAVTWSLTSPSLAAGAAWERAASADAGEAAGIAPGRATDALFGAPALAGAGAAGARARTAGGVGATCGGAGALFAAASLCCCGAVFSAGAGADANWD
jgi:hypothetical protein